MNVIRTPEHDGTCHDAPERDNGYEAHLITIASSTGAIEVTRKASLKSRPPVRDRYPAVHGKRLGTFGSRHPAAPPFVTDSHGELLTILSVFDAGGSRRGRHRASIEYGGMWHQEATRWLC
jgi:hypothetical protein